MAIPPILAAKVQPAPDVAPVAPTGLAQGEAALPAPVTDQIDIAPETSDPDKALRQVLELKKALQTTERSIDVAAAGLTLKRVQELLRED